MSRRSTWLALSGAAIVLACVAAALLTFKQASSPAPLLKTEPAETPAPARTTPPETATPVASPVAPETREADAGDGALSREQFVELTERTLRELPTAEDFKNLTEDEAHHYPEPLARAGGPLGRIAQAVHDQPSLRPQAERFYSECARAEALVVPVRALCYSHVIGSPQAPPAESLPAEVVRLAKLVPRAR
jgi:hypothetical protein